MFELGVERGEHLRLARARQRLLLGQHFGADAFIDRVAGFQVLHAIALRQPVLEEEAQQRIVGLVPMPEDFAARDDRRARAQHGALQRDVLQPLHPALQRRIPGGGKPLRAGTRTQLVERLDALPDPLGRQFDDAGGGKRGDKAPLEVGRDRIAARGGVEEGSEGEEGVVLLGLGGGVCDDGGGLPSYFAGGFGHRLPPPAFSSFSSVIARSRRRRGNPARAGLDCFAALAMTWRGSVARALGVAQSGSITP